MHMHNDELTLKKLAAMRGRAQILEDYIVQRAQDAYEEQGNYANLTLNELQRELEEQYLSIERLEKLLEKTE